MIPVRSSGVLLPVASLPGPADCGDFGPAARRFIDCLASHGVGLWQLLPLHPTDASFGYSPYAAQSVFAGDEVYISTEDLAAMLEESPTSETSAESLGRRSQKSELDLGSTANERGDFARSKVDYARAKVDRAAALDKAFAQLSPVNLARFNDWRGRQAAWLEEYAVWRALADLHGSIHWPAWPLDEHGGALAASSLAVDRVAFGQYVFAEQWAALRRYAATKVVRFFGDLPIYPQLDSADTWAHRQLFKLDERGLPTLVAGVPPDYFSEDGQLWGNPVYDWVALEASQFDWWVQRLTHAFQNYDRVRVDHFIGLVRAYEIEASAKTACDGTYLEVPTEALFRQLARRLPSFDLVAEDLGAEHPSVLAVMQRWDLPGMRVLQFGFGGGPNSPHLPHNYSLHTVAYTGTHDNNTLLGWHSDELTPQERLHWAAYVGAPTDAASAVLTALRLVLASSAATVVFPVQDLLGLDGGSRLNKPGTAQGNWLWRIDEATLFDVEKWKAFAQLNGLFGRSTLPDSPKSAYLIEFVA